MTSLPTGTVTFLFTDIEGSTRLLQAARDEYPDLLEIHRRLLREAVARAGGHEFETQGDGLFVAFATAKDALEATVDAQRALDAYAWPEGAAVRVRMALHTGRPTLTPGGYVGLDLHRTARICAAGHGGQILLSDATRALLEGDLPDGVTIVDLGEHRLKDLDQPLRLHQVVAVGLPHAFPALRTLEALPNNLPLLLTSFVGRVQQVADIKRLLTTQRLVTLIGVGGCGKSRLAHRAAAEALSAYPDGAWWVELAPVADPGLIPQTVASTLRLREQPGRSFVETLVDHFQFKNALLVLDNCEHLLMATAQLANSLLRACPGLRMMVTSREALNIDGEALYPVPPLSAPSGRSASVEGLDQNESIRLFVERATAVMPTFHLTAQNAQTVARVCERLDGLPLAIEMAVARVKALSVEQLAKRLDDRFRLLRGSSRTALPRHQTLQAALDWSYGLLSEPEQTVFRRLAVFAGGFDLEAAETVCAGETLPAAEVLDLLASLVDKSLVQVVAVEGEARYRQLETLRQYAQDRLVASEEMPAVRRRHLDWYVVLAERAAPEFESRNQLVWLERVDLEHDNLRAALEWGMESGKGVAAMRLATALHAFWVIRGYWGEALTWDERVLERKADAPASAVAAVLRGQGAILSLAGRDPDRRNSLIEESLTYFRQAGDARGLGRTMFQLGFSYSESDEARAQALWEEALTFARAAGDWVQVARIQINLAQLDYRRGDEQRAIALADESLRITRKVGDRWVSSLILLHLGEFAADRGEHARARPLLEESMLLARDLRHVWFVTIALVALASIAVEEHALARAARLFGAGDRLRETLGVESFESRRFGYRKLIERLQRTLGEAEFAAAWTAGRAMALDEAIEFALAVNPEESSVPR